MNLLKIVVLLCSAANADVCLTFEETVQAPNPSTCFAHSTTAVQAIEEHPEYVIKRISCRRP